MHSQPQHILVVDDDSAFADLLRIVLEVEGFVVSVAHSGTLAQRLLNERAFNALVLDLDLPDADGRQLLRDFRLNPATSALPVVVVSGYLSRMGEAEATAVLPKPADVTSLVAVLKDAISGRPAGQHRSGVEREALPLSPD